MSDVIVNAEDVCKRFRRLEVLPGMNLQVKRGEVARKRAEIGMVFQHFDLFPHMTAPENVTLAPITVGSVKRAEARARAEALLDQIGVSDKANVYAVALRRAPRVAVARALAVHPKRRIPGRRVCGGVREARRRSGQPAARTHADLSPQGALALAGGRRTPSRCSVARWVSASPRVRAGLRSNALPPTVTRWPRRLPLFARGAAVRGVGGWPDEPHGPRNREPCPIRSAR